MANYTFNPGLAVVCRALHHFCGCFLVTLFVLCTYRKKIFLCNKRLFILMVIAPAIFSLKMALHTDFPFSSNASWNEYWNQVYYWPLRLVIVTAILILLWKKFDNDRPFLRAYNQKPRLPGRQGSSGSLIR